VDAGRGAAAAARQKDEARAAYIKAIDASAAMQPERRDGYVKFIQEDLKQAMKYRRVYVPGVQLVKHRRYTHRPAQPILKTCNGLVS
jgi:hypothetical protein